MSTLREVEFWEKKSYGLIFIYAINISCCFENKSGKYSGKNCKKVIALTQMKINDGLDGSVSNGNYNPGQLLNILIFGRINRFFMMDWM